MLSPKELDASASSKRSQEQPNLDSAREQFSCHEGRGDWVRGPETPRPPPCSSSFVTNSSRRSPVGVASKSVKSQLDRDFFSSPVTLIRSTPKTTDETLKEAPSVLTPPYLRALDVEDQSTGKDSALAFNPITLFPAPNSYFGLSAFSWCCCPLNILAIVAFAFSLRSMRLYDRGYFRGSKQMGARAFCLGILALLVNAIAYGVLAALFVTYGIRRSLLGGWMGRNSTDAGV